MATQESCDAEFQRFLEEWQEAYDKSKNEQQRRRLVALALYTQAGLTKFAADSKMKQLRNNEGWLPKITPV